MPFTPDKLDTRVVAVTFTFGDDEMTIKYRPRAFSQDKQQAALKAVARVKELNALADDPTTDVAAKAAAAAEAEKLDGEASAWVAEILTWWDYVEYIEEDGTLGPMVPITPERISQELSTHTDLITACISAAAEDYNQGKSNGIASSARSGA